MPFTELPSGVEGRDEEGPGDPGDEGSEALLHPLPPPPPPTELDKDDPREEPTPNGALRGGARGREVMLFII